MKSPSILRSILLVSAAAFTLATAGCQSGGSGNNGNRVAGSTGPSGESGNTPSSGVGPGGHAPATNESHVGPTNAGPAGSR